jgi:hypothetical protein
MNTEEFKKYTTDRSTAQDGLVKVALESVLENGVPVFGPISTKIANTIQEQSDEKDRKDAFEYLDNTKISKDDVSIENVVKIIRTSKVSDWDYQESPLQEQYPKQIAMLNYRPNLDISIKVIENCESNTRSRWMPVTFIDDDFKWYNTGFIFLYKNKELVNDSVHCYKLDETFIPFEHDGKISKEDYDFAKLLNAIASGSDEQYLSFYTHQKGQNIVEDNYGEMDDITLYRFLRTLCDGEMIDWNDNTPHFENLGSQAKQFLRYSNNGK